MPNTRGGSIFDIFIDGGIGKPSKSINLRSSKIDIIRLKALGHLGVNFQEEYYGDKITWWELKSIGIKHGYNTVVKYPKLEKGWTYHLDPIAKVFTVTNDKGIKTVTKIKTLSDLGIVWEIFNSHQFKIYFSAKFINDAFLIGWILKKGYIIDDDGNIIPDEYDKSNTCVKNKEYLLAYVDQFFNETLHWTCNRFTERKKEDIPYIENRIMQELIETNKNEILRSNVPVRSATGDYTNMAIYGPDVIHVVPVKRRNAIIELVLGEFLMIACFASLMNMSKPVFEPWMLFGIWKWLCSSERIETIDKIFDLSPRW